MEKDITSKIEEFIDTLPPTISVIGYGSGVKHQRGYNENTKKQIDLFIVVDNLKEWHKKNYKLNKEHYSFSGKMILTKMPECIQRIGPKICYIPFIKYKEDSYKIGVITKDNLLDDLKNWKSFYMAGRFQKNNLIIKKDKDIENATIINRRNALVTALMLDGNFEGNLKDLYLKLCSLSYKGDIRKLLFLENPNKVKNLVEGSYDEINQIYLDDNINKFMEIDENDNFKTSYDVIKKMGINNLPDDLKKIIDKDFESLTKQDLKQIRFLISIYFLRKNLPNSVLQPIKGLFTAGIVKSGKYLGSKWWKSIKGLKVKIKDNYNETKHTLVKKKDKA